MEKTLYVQGYFKNKHTIDQRKHESKRIIEKYPDRLPIIVEVRKNDSIPPLDKQKYLVPSDLTIGQFIYVIRKRIRLDPHKALYLFFNNTLLPTSAPIGKIYDEHKDPDGFLYSIISCEDSFG
jgi:GABA(A) receptor-associated protein